MKKSIKFLSVILSFVLIFNAVGCGEKDPQENKPIEESNSSIQKEVVYTNTNFISDNKSDYTIVIPENCSQVELESANEFNTFLKLSTKVSLPIKYDNQVEYSEDAKLILIGRTKYLSELNINVSEDLGSQGYLIQNVGNSLIITGVNSQDIGTQNGVYDFLEYQIGLRFYDLEEVFYNEYENLNLVSLNIQNKPDIANFYNNGETSSNNQFRKRVKVAHRIDVFGNGISPYHNSFIYLPKASYKPEHPKWYSDNGDQICYTAHGDEQEYQALVNTIFNKMVDQINTYGQKVLTFTMEDNYDKCGCIACQRSAREYGAESGATVKLLNALSDKFKEYFEGQGKPNDIKLMFFAYYFFTSAPNPEKIQCNDNVYPLFCPYNEMDRTQDINSVKNTSVKNCIEKWMQLAKGLGLWIYTANFLNYLVPVDVISCKQTNFTYFAEKKPIYMFAEGQSGERISTGFTKLNYYLEYNLSWNTKLNVEELTKDYFIHYFKDASDTMFELYTSIKLKLKLLADKYGYTANLDADCANQKYFEYGTVVGWKNLINKAYQDIDYLKDENPELYKKLYDRIATESISIDYLLIKLHGTYFKESEVSKMKDDFYATCKAVGLSMFNMTKKISTAFN